MTQSLQRLLAVNKGFQPHKAPALTKEVHFFDQHYHRSIRLYDYLGVTFDWEKTPSGETR